MKIGVGIGGWRCEVGVEEVSSWGRDCDDAVVTVVVRVVMGVEVRVSRPAPREEVGIIYDVASTQTCSKTLHRK